MFVQLNPVWPDWANPAICLYLATWAVSLFWYQTKSRTSFPSLHQLKTRTLSCRENATKPKQLCQAAPVNSRFLFPFLSHYSFLYTIRHVLPKKSSFASFFSPVAIAHPTNLRAFIWRQLFVTSSNHQALSLYSHNHLSIDWLSEE